MLKTGSPMRALHGARRLPEKLAWRAADTDQGDPNAASTMGGLQPAMSTALLADAACSDRSCSNSQKYRHRLRASQSR